jgi:hypothetical protein
MAAILILCARSTAGEEWIEANIVNLFQKARSDRKRKEGRSYFRFGNRKPFNSKQFLVGIFNTTLSLKGAIINRWQFFSSSFSCSSPVIYWTNQAKADNSMYCLVL